MQNTIKTIKTISIAASALLFSSLSFSQVTGNWLHDTCEDKSSIYLCSAYIAGVAGGINAYQKINKQQAPLVCFPNESTNGQFEDIVKNHLRSIPEIRHQPAEVIILFSLKNSFPCK